ncbi:hypothetical protein OIO90_003271 [Microbotryomycetes sp. JL221]|nr:hypothetical protein OIO90_003271 [Microbotryomycetes sp. JL221]
MPLDPNASIFVPFSFARCLQPPTPPSNAHAPACSLSEQAQDLILEYVRDASDLEAEQTFAAVCLTTRHWLEAGQRALYRRPLAARQASWPRAHALVNTLRERIGLAAQVKDLRQLGQRVAELGVNYNNSPRRRHGRRDQRHRTKKAPEFQGSRSRWALELIQLCPLVKFVGVPLGTALSLKQVKDSLPNSVERLELMRVGKLRHSEAYSEVATLVTSRQFKSIHLRNFDHAQGDQEVDDDVPFVVTDLEPGSLLTDELELVSSLDDTMLRWNLLKAPTLFTKTLNIKTRSVTSSITHTSLLPKILLTQGNHLERVVIDSVSLESRRTVVTADYNITTDRLDFDRIRGTRWSALSSLTSLSLHCFYDIDPDTIERIVVDIPTLEDLSLRDSTWTEDMIHVLMEHDSIDKFESLVQHLQTVESTNGKNLQHYHLGYLPSILQNFHNKINSSENNLSFRVDMQLSRPGTSRTLTRRYRLALLTLLMPWDSDDDGYDFHAYSPDESESDWFDEDEDGGAY